MMFFQLYVENVEHVYHTKVIKYWRTTRHQLNQNRKSSRENDLNQVLKLAEELRIKNYLKF